MAAVVLTQDARDDLRDLDGAAQKLVVKALRKLETDPEQRGASLAGDLSTYRKLVVGDRAYRVIYSVESDGTVCVVWIIGKRANGEVYDLAKARLIAVDDEELHALLEEALERANALFQ